MNFKDFKNKVENRLTDAILSLWATGDKEMQDYFKYLIAKEPVIAEAVFQNTFPWEKGNMVFGETHNIFNEDFIKALDGMKDEEFQFPKSRFPYKHQLLSWKALLKDKKSIAVTTGTGSGKTECFMLPVLQDIYENCKNEVGINAIFLYPLNALIASQKKRMHAWCSSLSGINYALLTGDTPNSDRRINRKNEALPELITREQIRNKPPQILFTNPTMLEYMLVRNADVPILEKSKGKLRWILLDEAHTLTGSSAAEMALLIRRVVSAFDVNIKDLRFAITSATVGGENSEVLKKFMSDLCGIDQSQIVLINGKRVNDNIKNSEISGIDEILTKENIIRLREKFLKSVGLTQKQVGKILKIKDEQSQLEVLDKISETQINNENLLPLRGHFFTRGIGGVYVCTNGNCNEHKRNKPNNAIGTMYTIAGKKCNCGHPLLELVACRSCGHMMMEGQVKNHPTGEKYVYQKTSVGYEAFYVEQEDEDSENVETKPSYGKRMANFIKYDKSLEIKNDDVVPCAISEDNQILSEGNDFLYTEDGVCPNCNTKNDNHFHFRLSSALTNRILSDVVLDQVPESKNITTKTQFKGKKYISFTDSRQGTAKISALINIDSERDWIRYQVYHYLLKKLKNKDFQVSHDDLLVAREYLMTEMEKPLPKFLKDQNEQKLAEINEKLNDGGENLIKSRSTWKEIIDHIKVKDDFKTLFIKSARGRDITVQGETYAKALLYDQFAMKLRRERSMENLGLVNLSYPSLDNTALPRIAENLSITKDEWRSLLKIAMDYLIRNNYHFFFDDAMRNFTSKSFRSDAIYPSNSEVVNAKKWKLYNSNSIAQSRFVLLICAGLGWHEVDDISKSKEDQLNELLEKIWTTIREKVLTSDGDGFKLNFFENTQFEIAGEEFLCPATNRLVDKVFRGYSPLIKGNLEYSNIKNYKINKEKTNKFPLYPSPFHKNESNQLLNKKEVENWLVENSRESREKGLWNNLHSRIFDYEKLYLAGEHSAQQDKKRLKQLESQFEEGEINILSCSTTMEMGVDIGGISAVVMSNVPPMPANYLQRTGRAGRRAENKSLALTFCSPNPIGLRTMNNPAWALEHEIAPPILAFDSKNIIERHVNSMLFGEFIRMFKSGGQGLNIKENIEMFFIKGEPTIAQEFQNWLSNVDIENYSGDLLQLIKGTPLSHYRPEQLVNVVIDNFNKIVVKVRNQKLGFKEKLEELITEFGENSPAYKAVNYRRGQFYQKFVLSFLAEENFLPNAGLPTGIVEFENISIDDLKKNNPEKYKSNPSYTITRALTEFAPGNNILIDGLNYKSSGIILKNNRGEGAKRTTIQACSNCGYQRTIDYGSIKENCPKCEQSNTFIGIDLGDHRGAFTELVEPAGFAVDLYRQPTRVVSEKSKPQYLEPLLLNISPWPSEQNGLLDFRSSENDDETAILFYNTGNGEGYSLCLDCGRVESTSEKLEGHKRLRGGKSNDENSLCSANNVRDHIILGSKFKTDFTELRIKNIDGSYVQDKKLAYSLGIIFTKTLAEVLAIEEGELGFGVKKYNGYLTIFIYDTAKGGAGYASQFNLHSEDILKHSLSILVNCECRSTGCTRCLIDRNTQWKIEDIDRFKAIEWLTNAVNIQIPDNLTDSNFNISPIYGSIQDEIKRQNYHFGIKEVNIHINNDFSEWQIENIKWLNQLKRIDIDVNLIIEGDISYRNNQEKLSTHLLSYNFCLKQGVNTKINSYNIHASIVLSNENVLSYISEAGIDSLCNDWSLNQEHNYFRVIGLENIEYENLPLPNISSSNLFESRIQQIPSGMQSNQLSQLMLSNLNHSDEFKEQVQGKSYVVSYYDKFNQSEFSLRILLQFLNELKNNLALDIDKLNIHLCRDDFRSYGYPEYIIHNYNDLEDYQSDLSNLSENFEFDVDLVFEDKMPHYRYFKFSGQSGSFEIRVDGGIAHGLKPVERLHSQEMSYDDEVFTIRKDVKHDIIYNVCINN